MKEKRKRSQTGSLSLAEYSAIGKPHTVDKHCVQPLKVSSLIATQFSLHQIHRRDDKQNHGASRPGNSRQVNCLCQGNIVCFASSRQRASLCALRCTVLQRPSVLFTSYAMSKSLIRQWAPQVAQRPLNRCTTLWGSLTEAPTVGRGKASSMFPRQFSSIPQRAEKKCSSTSNWKSITSSLRPVTPSISRYVTTLWLDLWLERRKWHETRELHLPRVDVIILVSTPPQLRALPLSS